MPHRVRETFAGGEVRGRLDVGGGPRAGRPHLDRERCPAREIPQRGPEAGVELRRPQPARQLAQLVDREGDLRDRPLQRLRHLRHGGSEGVLGVPQGEPDRDEALLGAVVQVAFDPPALRVCSSDYSRPRGLDLGQATAQLDAQLGDLDCQPAGLDELPEQRSMLRTCHAVQHLFERLAASLDWYALPPVVGRVRNEHPLRVDIELALGEEEVQLERRIRHQLAQQRFDALRCRAAGAQVVEEARHAMQCVVASPVEPSIHRVLHPRPHRTERNRDNERRDRGRPRRAAAECRTQEQHGRGERSGEHGGHRPVHQRPVDDHVDPVQSAPQDREACGEREGGEREAEHGYPGR